MLCYVTILDVPGQGSSSRMRPRSGHDLGAEKGSGLEVVQRFEISFDVEIWDVEFVFEFRFPRFLVLATTLMCA